MATSNDTKRSIEAHKRWLGYLQPDGLVVSAAALVDKGHYYQQAQRERQLEFIDHLEAHQKYDEEEGIVEIVDFKTLATEFLEWPEQEWVDADDLGDDYHVHLRECQETLSPTAALRWPRGKDLDDNIPPYQLLIQEYDGDFDEAYEVVKNTWSTSATHRLERLLHETGISIGLLVSKTHLRVVYAPVGENAGSLTFHFADMLETMGRPILGAFDLLLGIEMLFIGEESEQLPALLKYSREVQANVSIELARQVLDGLYDLVRGTQAADARTGGELLRYQLETNPNLIYEGQLNVLMRIVFLLFAEDRGLMPNSDLYNQHYSVHALYERLRQDQAIHHDTMDERYGAWAQLLALFRLVFDGHRHRDLRLPARYGYLFDPDRFPFLEGRAIDPETEKEVDLSIPLIGDGTLFRLLQGLLFLNGERISYRTLDVEQIGSVYETMMGFELARAVGQTIAIRPQKKHGAAVNLNLDHLLALPAKGTENRHKFFTQETGRKFSVKRLKEFNDAKTVEELLVVFQGATANSDVIARNATPHLAQPGALLLQPNDARRKSGSHYTPRKLTEPIVRKALEPVLANLTRDETESIQQGAVTDSTGLDEGGGLSTESKVPFPGQILGLKVCDPAVGSGAFLVEACRQLGDELVKAWAVHGGKPVIPVDEDEVLHARRLVAQRCLYGVDRNPMAADLAKLSLWLATLAKDHPFTFLAHAIRSGDSLVGLSKKQILAFHWDLNHTSAKQRVFGQDQLEKKIKSALAYRQEILDAGDLVLPEMKAAQLRLAEEEVDKVRRAGDLAVLGFFSGSKPKERQEARDNLLERWLKATDQSGSEESLREGIALKDEIRLARESEKPVFPFHWEVEFPEVFERKNPGFDSFVGNPPFAGKNNLAGGNRSGFLDWLKTIHEESHGNSDLVAHFFRRAFTLIHNDGTLGLIATNTIGQGDTRATGLRWIRAKGGTIYGAIRRKSWPGEAAVVVSVVWCSKSERPPSSHLDGSPVDKITAYLFHAGGDENAKVLQENLGSAFVGNFVLGQGFTFDDKNSSGEANTIADYHRLTQANPKNSERIFQYINGQEVNSTPNHKPCRFIINFGSMTEKEASHWPDLLNIVREKVRPNRLNQGSIVNPERWWMFARSAADLYTAVEGHSRVIVRALTSTNFFTFTFLPTGIVYDQTLIVFAFESNSALSILLSRCHEGWTLLQGGTMKDDPRYNVEDCFKTFPFPLAWESNAHLEEIGREYYDYRAELMVRNDEGLTKTYNRFHDPGETSPEIHKMRLLHAAMDRAVLDAYGWTDVPTDCEFIPDFTEEDDDGNEIPKNIRYRWPDEVRDDVLARLLALNSERYEQEVNAGLHSKSTKKKSTRKVAKKTTRKVGETTFDPGVPFPEETRIAASSPSLYAMNFITAVISEAGGSLEWTRLRDSFVLATTPGLLRKFSLAEEVDRVTQWESAWNETAASDLLVPSLLTLLQSPTLQRDPLSSDKKFELMDGPVEPATAHVRFDAWLSLTVASRLTSVDVDSLVINALDREIEIKLPI
ncbi:MAG: hypothetical protein P1U86_05750 [Verrucomicrobiales bacterium]|nr:hypothetical protein [Verrucomicrobiales bacterium]